MQRLMASWERHVPEKNKGHVKPEDSAAQLRLVAKPRLRGVVAGSAASVLERSHELLDKATVGDAAGVQRLLSLNADVNTVDGGRDDVTPLLNAASAGSRATVEVLLRAKADVTRYDRFGWTALHRASGLGHIEVVEALVEGGCSRAARDSKGMEPADLARIMGQEKLALALSSEREDGHVPADLRRLRAKPPQNAQKIQEGASKTAEKIKGGSPETAQKIEEVAPESAQKIEEGAPETAQRLEGGAPENAERLEGEAINTQASETAVSA